MTAHPRGVLRRAEAHRDGEIESAAGADRHRLAMQQRVAEGERGLESMAEGVPEIEERAIAGLALVRADDAGLGAAALRDRMGLAALSPSSRRAALASHQAKNSGSSMSPYFTTSA